MCFTQEDKCIEYSGPSNTQIGVTQGMKQSEFNAQIVSTLSLILSKLENCNCSSSTRVSLDKDISLVNEVYKAYTASKCQSEIVNRTIDYSFTNNIFSYSINSFSESLPSGFNIESARVRLSKNNTTIANLSGLSSGLTLSDLELPTTVKFEIKVNSQCGQILLEKSFILSSPVTTNSTLNIQDTGSQYNLKTQADFNDLIYSRLKNLESKI